MERWPVKKEYGWNKHPRQLSFLLISDFKMFSAVRADLVFCYRIYPASDKQKMLCDLCVFLFPFCVNTGKHHYVIYHAKVPLHLNLQRHNVLSPLNWSSHTCYQTVDTRATLSFIHIIGVMLPSDEVKSNIYPLLARSVMVLPSPGRKIWLFSCQRFHSFGDEGVIHNKV